MCERKPPPDTTNNDTDDDDAKKDENKKLNKTKSKPENVPQEPEPERLIPNDNLV
jgi:hypothetical protein